VDRGGELGRKHRSQVNAEGMAGLNNHMEQLKRLEDIYEPDARYVGRVDLDLTAGVAAAMTVESVYLAVEPIRLNFSVPEDVRSQFEVARNLALYSWFVYSFHEAAAMQAMASLEMAARAKSGEPETPFKNLLEKLFPGRELAPGISLGKAVTYFRNEFAHGSTMLTGQGVMFLRRCSELINELYP
jgi:hypothetical protein